MTLTRKNCHDETRELGPTAQRTRRNVIGMGAIFVSVALARTKASANCGHKACKCFLKGTRIQTADGERKVEDLSIGDMLPTVFGGARPVRWIGRYPIKKTEPAKPWPKEAQPVRIARSALALGVPHAPLYVTAGHALLIDGLLVQAGMLVNGTTITRYAALKYDELEFFHIKLESHDVIYAEGAPVDTLLKVDESMVNFAEYFRRYGMEQTEAIPCAPRVPYTGGRDELKSRMRSAISPAFDRRQPFDVIRDRLEERGITLSRNPEFSLVDEI